jgi:hypothetical protein
MHCKHYQYQAISTGGQRWTKILNFIIEEIETDYIKSLELIKLANIEKNALLVTNLLNTWDKSVPHRHLFGLR